MQEGGGGRCGAVHEEECGYSEQAWWLGKVAGCDSMACIVKTTRVHNETTNLGCGALYRIIRSMRRDESPLGTIQ